MSISRPEVSPSRVPAVRGRAALGVARLMLPVLVVAALIGLAWLALIVFRIQTYQVPAPPEVLKALVDNGPTLLSNFWPTFLEAGLGFALGNGIAIVLAVIFVHSNLAQRALFPVAVFAQTVPIVAIAPLLVIVFGYGPAPKVIISALVCFFPTLVNMVTGLRAVDPEMLELMEVMSARPWETLLRVRWFTALPYLFSALRIAATTCVLGAIVAEWIGSQSGLGYLIVQTTLNYETPLLYATMLVTSVLALGATLLVRIAERLVVRWEFV